MAKDHYPIPKGVECPCQAATEAEVGEVEQKLGMRFPDDYREFLMTVNGAVAMTGILEIPMKTRTGDEDEPWGVARIYGISQDAPSYLALLPSQRAYQFDERVPKHYLIIGDTWGVDQVCMSLADPARGKVYFWCPDIGADEPLEENSTKHLWPAANSFREFWSKLRPDNETQ
jgi:hypothetical protein